MPRLIFFILLLVHSIGHLQGAIVASGFKDFEKWNANSWPLHKWVSIQAQHTICLILYVITSLITLAVALCFKEWALSNCSWKLLGFWAATFSWISMFIFPSAFAMFFNYIGAVSVNILLYYSFIISDGWLVKA